MADSEAAEVWAVIEIMGHKTYAGRVSQDASLGVPLLRVDVPSVGEAQGFTKLFGAGAIHGLTLCTEEAAREVAAQFRSRPVTLFHVDHQPRLPHISGPFEDGDGDYDEG